MPKTMNLTLRTQVLRRDRRTRNHWKVRARQAKLRTDATALLLCDVWDTHTDRGAAERLDAMVPRMSRLVNAARRAGLLIIHAPSDVIDFYRDLPARTRVLNVPKVKPPKQKKHHDPPPPFPRESALSDTLDPKRRGRSYPWKRQHPGIRIADTDVISADGSEVYSVLRHLHIRNLLILGVHTNYCILHRTFAIKQMVRWGVSVVLVRDLTDAIYDPATPPYVSHDEGTQLVVGYIEKFWCPTICAQELLKALA